jgi:hypothetical protein
MVGGSAYGRDYNKNDMFPWLGASNSDELEELLQQNKALTVVWRSILLPAKCLTLTVN